MTAKLAISPRKSATQRRSRQTVDVLLEATARILVSEGYDRASTNRIAQVAGVSVGSLYQYFPSKEALLAAVIDRHAAELRRVATSALIRAAALPVCAAVRELVKVAIDAHRINPALHRVLAEQTPRVGRADAILGLDPAGHALLRAYLEAHREELGVADLDMAALVVATTVESLTHTAVIHRPDILGEGRAELFIDDVTRLVLGYLAPGKV
jgi:AcrR family transcriptional regulator